MLASDLQFTAVRLPRGAGSCFSTAGVPLTIPPGPPRRNVTRMAPETDRQGRVVTGVATAVA